MIRAAFLACLLALMPLSGVAHNVIASVFPAGRDIEGEIGFSSGTMATGQLVEVFDAEGAKLGEAVTDEDGFFLFTPTQPVMHVFRADMGAGHVAVMTMSADEVAALLGVAAPAPLPESAAPSDPSARASATVASLTDEERAAIAQIVRTELRPLRQEITSYKSENDLQTILGGIGYIIGLFGLGFYLAARRKLSD